MSKIHEYFKLKPAKWNIIDFLNESGTEPFEIKIDHYIKSLKAIIVCEKGVNQERAKLLLDRYKKDDQPDYHSARKWKNDCESAGAIGGPSLHLHNPTFTGNPLLGNSGSVSGGTSVNLLESSPKRNKEDHEEDDDKEIKRPKMTFQLPSSRSSLNVVTPPPPDNIAPPCYSYFGVHTCPPRDSLQAQSDSLEDDGDCFDDLYDDNTNENPSTEVQHLIAKMENANHRLFEYRIVNLSEENLVNPVNKAFSDDDKKIMRKFWEEMEPSTGEKLNTVRKSKWEKSIKPLVDKYASAVGKSGFDDEIQPPSTEVIFEKPFEGKFDFRTHYDLLWVQDIYRRFVFLFASSFNMLRDANTLEIAYRESFVNPIIPKVFDDMKDKIRFQTGEIESMLRKQHRNQTISQKPRVMLGSNHDGILKIYVNASEIEIGFLEVVGNATVVDFTKYREDMEKLFKVMQLSIFYQRKHHLRRGATEKQLECLQSFGVLVYQRETIIYTMHRVKGGLHIVDILTNFTIPDNEDQSYVLDEIIKKAYFFKSRVMDYYLKIQEISRNAQRYTPSKENPLKASPPKKEQQKESRIEEIIPKK